MFLRILGIEEQLFVDTSKTNKLKINVDFVFPRVSCDYLSLDAQDVSGAQVRLYLYFLESAVITLV